jgi:hypothetical protein
MTKSRELSYSQQVTNFQASFHGQPIDPSELGAWHSFVYRNLLIHHPSEAEQKLQAVYKREGSVAITRGKDIRALILRDKRWTSGNSLSEKIPVDVKQAADKKDGEVTVLDNWVKEMLTQYYDRSNRLENFTTREAKARHEKEIEKEKQHLKDAKTAQMVGSREAIAQKQYEIDMLRKFADEIEAEYTKSIPSSSENVKKETAAEKENRLNLKARHDALRKEIAEKKGELDGLQFPRDKALQDMIKRYALAEKTALELNRAMVELALKKHITQLDLWRWLHQQLNDKSENNQIRNHYLAYAKDKSSVENLHALVELIFKNPAAELFKSFHEGKGRIAIKSYIKQKVAAYGTKNKMIPWDYVCPVTEYGQKYYNFSGAASSNTSGGKSPGATKKASLTPRGSNSPLPPSPRSKNALSVVVKDSEVKQSSPPKSARQHQLPLPVLTSSHSGTESGRSEFKIDLSDPALQSMSGKSGDFQDQKQASPVSTASPSKSLFVAANEKFEIEFNRNKPTPELFWDVITKNPLRWVAAAANGLAEGTLRLFSCHPCLKYSMGFVFGGLFAGGAMITNMVVDGASWATRGFFKEFLPWVFCCRCGCCDKCCHRTKENTVRYTEDLPRTPTPRPGTASVGRKSPRSQVMGSPQLNSRIVNSPGITPSSSEVELQALTAAGASQQKPALPGEVNLSIDTALPVQTASDVAVQISPQQPDSAGSPKKILNILFSHQTDAKSTPDAALVDRSVVKSGTGDSLHVLRVGKHRHHESTVYSFPFNQGSASSPMHLVDVGEEAEAQPKQAATV